MITQEQAAARRRLVKALRSGKYTQTQGKLRSKATGGMCCQGVQCDLVNKSAWLPNLNTDAVSWNEQEIEWPNDVREDLGLTYDSGKLLMNMNDGAGRFDLDIHSFDEIADCIDLLTLADEQPSKAYTAWIEIARRFAEGEVRDSGLCYQIDILADGWDYEAGVEAPRLLSYLEGAEMKEKINAYLPDGQVYAYQANPNNIWSCAKEDEARCLAAIWLALEAEEAADLAADEVTNGG